MFDNPPAQHAAVEDMKRANKLAEESVKMRQREAEARKRAQDADLRLKTQQTQQNK